MKTILTRLTEKLCEVEAIREDIEWIEINKHYPAPIQLNHLIWYCDTKDINLVITQKGWIGEPRERYTALLDITKDLSNQSEETLEAILNFITG